MKFFRNLFYKTFTGKIIKTIKSLYDYLKDYEYISDTFYSDAFKIVLKEYLNVEIKKDWIGRLYGDRKSTRLNSSHNGRSRMPSSA